MSQSNKDTESKHVCSFIQKQPIQTESQLSQVHSEHYIRVPYNRPTIYWELNWKLQAELIAPHNLVAHDLIQHIMEKGLRHAGGPVPSLLLHLSKYICMKLPQAPTEEYSPLPNVSMVCVKRFRKKFNIVYHICRELTLAVDNLSRKLILSFWAAAKLGQLFA